MVDSYEEFQCTWNGRIIARRAPLKRVDSTCVMYKRSTAKGRLEAGGYIALPHVVLRHDKFAQLSPRATKLFLDLYANYNGSNNGDFSAAWSLMKNRGWRSRDQLHKAQTELVDSRFIIKTRQGGRNRCNLFAVTFWAIDECKGKLDVPATTKPPGDWKN